jgi:ADP-ribose pyrophosphatase YjhB (NUDIX family)
VGTGRGKPGEDDIPVNASSVALVEGSRVLLIRRARPPYAGLWTLPGGRSEPGEAPADTARREIAEELGVDVEALIPVTRLEAAPGWHLAVFATRSFDGEIVPSTEIAAWRWVTAEEAQDLETTPGLSGVIEAALRSLEPRP